AWLLRTHQHQCCCWWTLGLLLKITRQSSRLYLHKTS
ncbi:hypothetical protein V3C99_018017, partial [Haemonchus contortus]